MKTINEAATAWANSNAYPKNKEEYGKILHRSYKRGVEFAQQWIDVNDELPNPYVSVLIKSETLSLVVLGFFDGLNMWCTQIECEPINKVTHWRPIELKSLIINH